MKSTAEKIADIIGYENFLRAEAYYYTDEILGAKIYEDNFVDHLNQRAGILRSFHWGCTEEGGVFWSHMHNLIQGLK